MSIDVTQGLYRHSLYYSSSVSSGKYPTFFTASPTAVATLKSCLGLYFNAHISEMTIVSDVVINTLSLGLQSAYSVYTIHMHRIPRS